MMEYNGYTGQITTVDEIQGLIHGRVAGINDVVTFEGKTFEDLRQAFHDSVDDYLDFCGERKEPPQKPFSGKFVVRIPAELHRQAALAAKRSGESLNGWVASAMQAQIQRARTKRQRRTEAARPKDFKTLLGILELRILEDLRKRREVAASEKSEPGDG
jgi:predicted HicB family RNase H-like nuclease